MSETFGGLGAFLSSARRVPVTEDENTITAKCVGDAPTALTLQAKGQTIGEAKDADGIENGNIGVRVGSKESFVTLRFDDFVLKYL